MNLLTPFQTIPLEAEKGFYPEPYFKIEGKKAIAKYGNYIPDLFELNKQGSMGIQP